MVLGFTSASIGLFFAMSGELVKKRLGMIAKNTNM